MRPFKFKECNVIFAKDQPEYNQLPAFRNESPNGEVITCWQLSFKERLQVLFFGKVWLNLLTFNRPLTPSAMATSKAEIYKYLG